ncbi:hypothetical protein, partial [Gemmatimonas sp.]|uniref:hypothetical protein n=1 Tax=Gemmatimonas sp. TaxID=1962908 RepID=UPI00286B2B2B
MFKAVGSRFSRQRWLDMAIVGIVALLTPDVAVAQSAPYVKVSPGNAFFTGQSTADVTIDYCYSDTQVGDPRVRVNSTDVTSSASIEYVTLSGCDQAQRATLTVNLPATVEGRFNAYSNSYLYNDVAYYEVATPTRDVRVQPGAQIKAVAPSSTPTVSYTIHNGGEATDSYSLSASCSSGALTGTCTLSASSVSIAAGSSATVQLTGTASSMVGTQSLVVVRATSTNDGTIKDSTWTEVTVASTPASGIQLATVGDDRDRSACLSLAAGPNAAYECGDLRLVHFLPSTTRYNRSRTPALLYNSQTASPAPAVSVDVSAASGSATPDYLEICVTASGMTAVCANSTPPSPGTTHRYTRVLSGWTQPTGRYPITVEVASVTGGTRTSQTVTSAIAVVNRSQSPYGAGWWLTGIDQIIGAPASVDTLLWVGADGSTRTFGSIGTLSGVKRFVARSLDRPDTIHYTGTELYRRHSNDRYTTYFSLSTGLYASTVSAFGQTVDACSSMTSAGACSTWSMGATYTLAFGSGKLDSVVAPAGAVSRVVKLTYSGSQVATIVDPDTYSTTFSYESGTNRVSARRDKRLKYTKFTWANGRLTSWMLDSAGIRATTAVQPAEVKGVPGDGFALLDDMHTLITGPRTDVVDQSRVWVNGYGAPTRIRDALGYETQLTYDATWKLLVTRTQNPLRMVSEAYYNTRALTDSMRVIGGRTGTDTTRTQYRWDAKWRSPVAVRNPVGVLDSTIYSSSDGTTLSTIHGVGGTAATFAYYSTGAATGQVRAVQRPLAGAWDSLSYDSNGNVSRVRSAKGFTSLIFRDAVGRDTMSIAPIDSATAMDSASVVANGVRTITRFDRMGRDSVHVTAGRQRTDLRSRVHPADSVWQLHSYDAEGNRTETVRRYRQVGASGYTNLTHTWVIDALGRVQSEAAPGVGSTTYGYDLSSNLVVKQSPRALKDSMVYDVKGRLIRRILPQVTYGTTNCTSLSTQLSSCTFSFPTRLSGVCIAADTMRYRYNAGDMMVNADNRWARVRRVYSPGGLLVSDTLRTRTWYTSAIDGCEEASPTSSGTYYPSRFDQHVYGLDFTYDAAGRRRSMSHPDAIDACTSARCVQQYGYHTVTGTLDTLLDRGSYTHTFAYDAAGRMVQKVSPGSVTETLAYDSDDRLIRRAVGSMIADTLTLDAAGRASVVRGAYPAVNPAALSYNGLGALVASTDLSGASSYEDFTVDGLGNRRFAARPSSRTSGHADGNRMRINAYDGAGRMTSTSDSSTVPSLSSQYSFARAQVFDDAGNLLWRGERELDAATSENRYDHLLNYYGADDKLAVANRHIGVSPVGDDSRPGTRGVWEMYRYDALGRRVQTYSVRGSACPSSATECASYFERTVWDGDQLLYEIRTPVTSPTNDLAGGGTYGSFGRVAYLHGGGIDAPLAVTRFDEAGQPAVQTLAPHANWQGDYVDGTTMSGGAVATCTGASGCPRLEWRGGKETADGAATAPGDYPWWGRLVVGQLDGSGLKYQRNRFYDPLTGQFTQADP